MWCQTSAIEWRCTTSIQLNGLQRDATKRLALQASSQTTGRRRSCWMKFRGRSSKGRKHCGVRSRGKRISNPSSVAEASARPSEVLPARYSPNPVVPSRNVSELFFRMTGLVNGSQSSPFCGGESALRSRARKECAFTTRGILQGVFCGVPLQQADRSQELASPVQESKRPRTAPPVATNRTNAQIHAAANQLIAGEASRLLPGLRALDATGLLHIMVEATEQLTKRKAAGASVQGMPLQQQQQVWVAACLCRIMFVSSVGSTLLVSLGHPNCHLFAWTFCCGQGADWYPDTCNSVQRQVHSPLQAASFEQIQRLTCSMPID